MDYLLKKETKCGGGTDRPLVLVIMDGIGIGKRDKGDAVALAEPLMLQKYIEDAKAAGLYCELKAHGPAVGLPSEEDMGNSEVGHNAMGSGQIYSQGAKRVNEAILNGEIFLSEAWKTVVEGCAKRKKRLHFFGLLSDGGVHSNISQLFKLLDGAVASGVRELRVHPLLDGRDVAPDSGLLYIEKLENKLQELNTTHAALGVNAKIASGGGRMSVTMDRYYSDWNIVRRGWWAHVLGIVKSPEATAEYSGYFQSAKEAILTARKLFPTKLDQYNPPFVIVDEKGRAVGRMESGDAVINFNFRGDRSIQISEAFLKSNQQFSAFDRGDYPGYPNLPDVSYAGLLEYDSEIHLPPLFLVPPPSIQNVLGQYLCAMKVKSYAIAETHKFGHVSYFWNGNRSGYIDGTLEKFEEIKSLPNETIEAQPEMRIHEVTEKFLKVIAEKRYDFLRVNFANGDMVGHTGNLQSAIRAVKVTDECVKTVTEAALAIGAVVVITADHGNAEEMLDKNGKPMTGHTLNPVPFIIIDPKCNKKYQVSTSGIAEPGIANVTATLLNLLGWEAPSFYQKSLV